MSQLLSICIAVLILVVTSCTNEKPREIEPAGSLEQVNTSHEQAKQINVVEPVNKVESFSAEEKVPAPVLRKSPPVKKIESQYEDTRLSSSQNSNQPLNTFSLRAPAPSQRKKLFTLSAKLSTFSNLEKSDSNLDETGSLLEISPSLRLGDVARVSTLVSVEFDHITDESHLLNTVIVLSRNPIQLNYDSSLNLSAQIYLPTDKRAYDEATLRGGAGATAGVRRTFRLFSKQASVGYALNGLKNIHKYDRTNLRAANISHRLRHLGDVETELTRNVTLSVGGYFQTGWTYENVVRDSYTFAQSVSYRVNNQLTVAAEHSTAGRFFTADGSEWDAKLFDPHDSVVGVSVSGTF